MQNVNWRTRRPPLFNNFSNYSTPTYIAVVLFVVIQRSKLHTDSAEVPVLHTPVEVAEVKWYVYEYHELPGMWYEIKQKQQKIPKVRANINEYSSTRCSGSYLTLSCLTVSFSCGIVYSRAKRTPESEKKQMSVYLIKRKIKKNVGIRTRYVYIPFGCSTRRRCEL